MVRALLLLLALLTLPTVDAQAGQEKPNIIVILADDMGYGDIGCFGQETLETPNLDRMAREGLRFTRFYAGSTVCAPSRCVLMTGLHTGHCSVRGNGPAVLPETDTTVAEVLKKAGYRTGCTGKWGIGNPPPLDDPNRHGFDYFFGYVNMYHAHNFYPEFLYRNGERVPLRNVIDPVWKEGDRLDGGPKEGSGVAIEKKDYAPDRITWEALDFIERNKERPFFLYYALNVPHANNEGQRPPQSDGMEVPDYGEYAAREEWPNPEKGFASMIRNIDRDVGKLLDKLKQLEIDKRTLVLFTSDNGPHQEGKHEMEFFNSNGALNGMKRDLTEGGIRVPAIAWWPGIILPGRKTDHIAAFQDFLPTAAEIAGVEPPEDLDGHSLLPVIRGESNQPEHEYLYWEFSEKGGRKAVLRDEWKLILLNTDDESKTEVQLFNLSDDPGETSNIAHMYPGKVADLKADMEAAHRDPEE